MFMPPIIPSVSESTAGPGHFHLHHNILIWLETSTAHGAATWFQDTLYKLTGVSLLLSEVDAEAKGSIAFRLQAQLPPGSYTLQIAPEGIEIGASDAAGFVHAVSSLLQSVPFDSPTTPGEWQLPQITIHDAPRFSWRGLMLDSVRHFQPVDWVKKFIDVMALHKFNILHWHLTDDQGWRIEIEKYPALTSISAWRVSRASGFTERTTATFSMVALMVASTLRLSCANL
jgi:hexosaminidase